MTNWTKKTIRKGCQCIWCHRNDLDHGVETYMGERVYDGFCEDCGTVDDVYNVLIVALETGKPSKADEYIIVDYTDVLGNRFDGWEVNNLARLDSSIVITDDTSDGEILKVLKSRHILSDVATENTVTVDWLDDTFCELYETKTGYPLCRLEKKVRKGVK